MFCLSGTMWLFLIYKSLIMVMLRSYIYYYVVSYTVLIVMSIIIVWAYSGWYFVIQQILAE